MFVLALACRCLGDAAKSKILIRFPRLEKDASNTTRRSHASKSRSKYAQPCKLFDANVCTFSSKGRQTGSPDSQLRQRLTSKRWPHKERTTWCAAAVLLCNLATGVQMDTLRSSGAREIATTGVRLEPVMKCATLLPVGADRCFA